MSPALSMPSCASATAAHEPRAIHAFILLVTSGLAVLVTAILGPSLPLMQQHFAQIQHADYLVPLTMTVPLLMMTLLAVLAGWLSDRLGRKRLLVGAAVLYGVIGTAPLYLNSLTHIVASRLALGVTEAVLMTVSTTMIGDYYRGAQRERFMALQVTVASASAFVLNNLGGVIAEHGWRAPYVVYAISLPLAALMARFLWEPLDRGADGEMLAEHAQEEPFRPRLLAGICALGVIAGLAFLIVPVHFAYLLEAIGVSSPSQIGIAYGLNSLGVIAGTLVFGWVLTRFQVNVQLAVSAAIAAAGLIGLKIADTYVLLVAASIINGLGSGMLLPTMVTWTMRSLPMAKRGLGTGAFQSSVFFGQFLSGFGIVALQSLVGGLRADAIGAVGWTLAALSVIAGVVGATRSR